MKKIVIVLGLILGSLFSAQAQHIKVVEGAEIYVKARLNETKQVEINLKNIAGKDLQILGVENVHHEIKVEELEDNWLPARETKTLILDVTPDRIGVQKLKILVKYALGKQRNTISFTIKMEA